MGAAKRELQRRLELQDLATSVALKAEALKPCPVHEDVYIDQLDVGAREDALKAAERLFAAGRVEGLSLDEFKAAVEDAIDQGADECGFCPGPDD